MKRTPIERKTPIRRSGSLPRVTHLQGRSRKRASQEAEYTTLRREFLAEYRFCALCDEYSEQVHHKAGRVGQLLLDVSKWLPVCAEDHQYITEHPAWAIAYGWSLKRTAADPSTRGTRDGS